MKKTKKKDPIVVGLVWFGILSGWALILFYVPGFWSIPASLAWMWIVIWAQDNLLSDTDQDNQ